MASLGRSVRIKARLRVLVERRQELVQKVGFESRRVVGSLECLLGCLGRYRLRSLVRTRAVEIEAVAVDAGVEAA